MPRFIVERTVGQLSQEEWESVGKKSNAALAQVGGGIVWVRSYISHAEGKVYCEYDAPSPEIVLEASRIAGLPVDRIAEIDLEISPSMFV